MNEGNYSSSQISAFGSSKKDAGRSLSTGTAQSPCEETGCGGCIKPTPGRRGQHIAGTGSSPSLSLVRARAQKGEQTAEHGLFSKRHFFAAKAPHVWQNVIPLIENNEWELCGTLPLMKIEYHPGTGTGLKRSSKGKGEQGEESQSLAIFEVADETPPQSKHLNSLPQICKLWGEAWIISSSEGAGGFMGTIVFSCGVLGHAVMSTGARRLWICFTNLV